MKRILLVVAVTLCVPFSPLSGAVLVVDPGGAGDFLEIQPALDAAGDGDTIMVKPGEYTVVEPLDFNRLFLYDSEDPTSPPPKDLVLRSETGPGATTIRASPAPAGSGLAAAMIFQHGESAASVVEGFTILGWTTGAWPPIGEAGAIICTRGSSPELRDCVISGDPAATPGCDGVYCGEGSSPTLRACTMARNRGRGVYAFESSPILIGCAVVENSMGMDCWGEDARPVLEGCTVRGNSGSGLFASGNATLTIRSSVFSGNGGDGLSLTASVAGNIEDCIIIGNGIGGIDCDGGASPVVRSSTIAFNAGSGVETDDGASPILERLTIAWNLGWGAGIYSDDSPAFESCIIWGNIGGSFYVGAAAHGTVNRSCVEGDIGLPGEGNISLDPLFCGWGGAAKVHVDGSSPGPGDGSVTSPFPSLARALDYSLSLSLGSPCLGAGEGGADMGDDLGTCLDPGVPARTVRVASGTYSIRGLSLAAGASILGAGEGETVIQGTMYGLRTGATVSHLTVTGGGAGITVKGRESPLIDHVTARGNRYGGFECWEATPTLSGCTAAGNYLYGIACYHSSPILINCAIWGNATNIDTGGVASVGTASSPVLVNCTIAGNLATRWGRAGVVCTQGGSATMVNCIVWGNTPQVTCGDATACLTGEDPLFVKEGVYDFQRYVQKEIDGLPVKVPDFIAEEPDLRLMPGSPAIDAGTCDGAPGSDIEGKPRPMGSGCDIGAHEAESEPAPPFIRGDSNGDGGTDLSDSVSVLSYLFLAADGFSCPEAADTNDDGSIDLSDAIYGLLFLFLSGEEPPEPWPGCGPDQTPDGLGCEFHGVCP